MLLDFFGGVILTATMVVVVNALISALDVPRIARLVLASLVGLWIGTQVSLATAGVFGSDIARLIPLIGIMVATPPLAVAIAAARSQSFRAALMGLPMPLLIGLNAGRVFGAFFLLLILAGRLAGPFPFWAGWGDVLVGTMALPLAVLVARRQVAPSAVMAWNALGVIDLIAAVTLGTLSFQGPLQVIHEGVGSDAIQFLPWALIPTVLVPFYLIVHGIIHAQVRAGARHETGALAG